MKIQKTKQQYLDVAKARGFSQTARLIMALLDLEFLPEPRVEEKWPERLEIDWHTGDGGPCLVGSPSQPEQSWWIDLSLSDSLSEVEESRIQELVARFNAVERWLRGNPRSTLGFWLREERDRVQRGGG